MENRIFLVVVDDSPEFPLALRYAARRAQAVGGRVAMLSVVEPEAIEAWGGVQRAMEDEAFDRARGVVAAHASVVREITWHDPVTYYKKGETRKVLLELIAQEKEISALVLAARTQDGASNPLIQYLTSDKGLRNLTIPLIVVPDTCCCHEVKV